MALSVVLATFNEEKNLPECLESIKNLAEEIVVVDGGSKDKTLEIARKYNAKIILTDNPAIFHINKQKAINEATKQWILQLDADERVTEELTKEIKSVIKSKQSEIVNGYWIPRKNWFLGRFLMKGGQYPDYTLRLYRRGKGKLPQESVHEQAVVEGKIINLTHPLIHMGDVSFLRYISRWNRYTNLLAIELKEKKLSPFSFFDFLFIKPVWWFLLTFVRHKGFMDGWQGFLFSFFSSARFPVSYMKYAKLKK